MSCFGMIFFNICMINVIRYNIMFYINICFIVINEFIVCF